MTTNRLNDKVFDKSYADQYDLLYGDKDYGAECDLIEEVFRRYAQGPVETVLDLGCGTGSHAALLACRGYRVTGVDRSAEMLEHARRKTRADLPPSKCHPPAFLQGDVRDLDLERRFDAVLMMFAVLGYQLTDDDVLSALRTVRRHLGPGGLFIADVWHGPAVLSLRPGDRVKVIPTEDGRLIRAASGTLDTDRQLCEVRYRLRRLRDGLGADESEETHRMRYFFPQELALLFRQTRLELLDIFASEGLDRVPDEKTWNVLVIGRSR